MVTAAATAALAAGGTSCLLLLLAAARFHHRATASLEWTAGAIEASAFCRFRRMMLTTDHLGAKMRASHIVQTEVDAVSVFCCSGHPHDCLHRMASMATTATLMFAVSLWWLRSSIGAGLSGIDASSERPDLGRHLLLALYTLFVAVPPLWVVSTAFAWLHLPVFDVIELGLRGPEERRAWRGLCCMPRRIVPYRAAERWLKGQDAQSTAEVESLARVEGPYFSHGVDGACARWQSVFSLRIGLPPTFVYICVVSAAPLHCSARHPAATRQPSRHDAAT